MKLTKYFIIFTIYLLPLLTSAQNFRFIAFADPQVTWIIPDNGIAENAGIRGGIDAGFDMDYFFSENYAFSTGLSINNLGGKLKFTEPVPFQFQGSADPELINPGDVIIFRLQYLNVPLGLKFTTREIGYSTYYVKLGTTGHISTRSHADISSLDIEKGNLENEIGNVTFSYHFGAGIHYSLGGTTALTGGIEYKNRFVDITTNTSFRTNLHSLGLRLGVLF